MSKFIKVASVSELSAGECQVVDAEGVRVAGAQLSFPPSLDLTFGKTRRPSKRHDLYFLRRVGTGAPMPNAGIDKLQRILSRTATS